MNRDSVLIHVNVPRSLINELEREYNLYKKYKMGFPFIPAATVKLAAIILNEAKRNPL